MDRHPSLVEISARDRLLRYRCAKGTDLNVKEKRTEQVSRIKLICCFFWLFDWSRQHSLYVLYQSDAKLKAIVVPIGSFQWYQALFWLVDATTSVQVLRHPVEKRSFSVLTWYHQIHSFMHKLVFSSSETVPFISCLLRGTFSENCLALKRLVFRKMLLHEKINATSKFLSSITLVSFDDNRE